MKRVSGATKHAIAIAAVAVAAIALSSPAVNAQTIIDEWASINAPAAPALKPVKLDPQKSALLVLDVLKQSCNAERRPRCVASVPKIEKLLADARAKNVLVVYALFRGAKLEDNLPQIAPKGGEPWVLSVADKFVGTDLEKILKDKGITTVVVVGTAAHGAVLYTASSAAMRGFQVAVPVDGMSAETPYAEQATAWLLSNAPTVAANVSLTRSDMIGY
jgi:nicotinamidase-related amidase